MLDLHWPILQVIIPFIAALTSALIVSVNYARFLAISSTLSTLIISLYGLINLENARSYYLGNWKAPIGVEYKLDNLNQPILVYISCALLLILATWSNQLIMQVEKYIISDRRHLLYTLLLLAHAGFMGIVATGDLFNLYVFLEISSLASYTLLSLGKQKDATVGALNYLILGTIGASLILIGIGMLYSATGTLNISDIHNRLVALYNSRIVILGLGFFITGCLLKIALFPLHFWMLKAYKASAPIIMVFLAGVSSVIGFYILLRFIYFVVDYKVLYSDLNFAAMIKCLGLIAIIINSYLALKAKNIRVLILYSIAAQIGYICILLIAPSPNMVGVLMSCILADSLIKISLFINMDEDGIIKYNKLTLSLLIFNILSNVGLPLTIGFINKINILGFLLNKQEYTIFIVVVLTSILSIEYNFRLFKMIYSKGYDSNVKTAPGLIISSLIAVGLMIFNNNFVGFYIKFFESF